jgi:hypothetical protein
LDDCFHDGITTKINKSNEEKQMRNESNEGLSTQFVTRVTGKSDRFWMKTEEEWVKVNLMDERFIMNNTEIIN